MRLQNNFRDFKNLKTEIDKKDKNCLLAQGISVKRSIFGLMVLRISN